MKTVFEMIIDNEIPSVKLYEDDVCIVILDINPIQKGHALVISKKPYPRFTLAPQDELSHMMEVAKRVDLKMREVLGADGTNIMINNETIATLKIVQTRYKKRYNKVVALGEIAESLCTKSLRSACYRELLKESL